ncbi:hypothetical protein [Microbacterium sp. NPDC096154]|uniref:hypothetical protein n=1 Tax=Microbacterium sp. NPDC096154 TaxID=3155549 RepID=UPI0033222189
MSESTQDQQPADDETIAKAQEANRLAAQHGVADPGGIPQPGDAEDAPPVDRPSAPGASSTGAAGEPLDEKADDVIEEIGPAQ